MMMSATPAAIRALTNEREYECGSLWKIDLSMIHHPLIERCCERMSVRTIRRLIRVPDIARGGTKASSSGRGTRRTSCIPGAGFGNAKFSHQLLPVKAKGMGFWAICLSDSHHVFSHFHQGCGDY